MQHGRTRDMRCAASGANAGATRLALRADYIVRIEAGLSVHVRAPFRRRFCRGRARWCCCVASSDARTAERLQCCVVGFASTTKMLGRRALLVRAARGFHASAGARAAEPACGAACATPAACADTKPAVDIAYKPAQSGWGFTKRYGAGWDRIFGKKDARSGSKEQVQADTAREPGEAAARS